MTKEKVRIDKDQLFCPYETKDLGIIMSKIATDLSRLQQLTNGKPTIEEIDRIWKTVIDRNTMGRVISEINFSYLPLEFWSKKGSAPFNFWEVNDRKPPLPYYQERGSYQISYYINGIVDPTCAMTSDPGGIPAQTAHEVGADDVFTWMLRYYPLNARYYKSNCLTSTRRLTSGTNHEIFFHEGEVERIKRYRRPGIVNFIGDCMGIWKSGSSKAGTILKG